jgi:hypothetical protein
MFILELRIVTYEPNMAKVDWVSCKIHVKMAEAIDRFIETDIAKKNAIMSRSDFLTAVLRKFFANYEKEYGIFVTRDTVKNTNGEYLSKPIEEQDLTIPPRIKGTKAMYREILKALEQRGFIVKESEASGKKGKGEYWSLTDPESKIDWRVKKKTGKEEEYEEAQAFIEFLTHSNASKEVA